MSGNMVTVRNRTECDRIAESWRPRLARFVRRLAGAEAPVEDLVQEILVRSIEAQPRRRRASQLSTWLFGIAVNVCREHRRDEARRLPPVDDTVLLDLPDVTFDPARLAAKREEREALQRALARLGAAHREVLLLRDSGGLSYREIAETLVIPVGTVRSRIHNATALLMQGVEEELR